MRGAMCVGPVAGALVLVPTFAAACPVCFGAADGAMLEGSNMGILALLLVTLAMLAAFGAFFRTLARREARASEVMPALVRSLDAPAGERR